VALLCEDGRLSQTRKLSFQRKWTPSKQAVTSGELAKPELLAPTQQWSARGWVPDAACSCGYECADGLAKPLWARAIHDEPW
jgi:hypothetical protein